MTMDRKDMVADVIKDVVAKLAAPQPLTEDDQAVAVYEDCEPEWKTIPFKQPMRILWDWGMFLQNATSRVKDSRLAIVGLSMSWTCELSSLLITSLFDMLGFENVWSSHYLLSTLQRNAVSQPARTFAHKAIEKDGQVYHLVCAAFKGTTTIEDAITDIKSVKDGFLEAGQNCADALRTYVQSIEGATNANTILFITGHSLGAATANVVGRLTKDVADDNMRFVYTYASPNYACEGDDEGDFLFANFRTFTNKADIVPMLPPNFPKIGLEYSYDYQELDEHQREKFDTAYTYFRGVAYEGDDDPVGFGITRISDPDFARGLKNHLAATYMSFILSDLSDDEMDLRIGDDVVQDEAAAKEWATAEEDEYASEGE